MLDAGIGSLRMKLGHKKHCVLEWGHKESWVLECGHTEFCGYNEPWELERGHKLTWVEK